MATVSAILYTSKKYKGDVYPIMIRVQHRGNRKYFKVGDESFNVRKNQWDADAKELKRDKRLNKNYLEQNYQILEQINNIQEVIKDFEKQDIAWTFNLLEQKLNSSANYVNFMTFVESRIVNFKKKGKYGTAQNYQRMLEGMINIFGYKRISKLEIADIDYAFIEHIIDYGREEVQKNNGTIGPRWRDGYIKSRLSQIKACLNDAIENGQGSPSTYPFSDKYGATKYIRTNDFQSAKRNKYVPSTFMEKFINYKCYDVKRMMYIKHHMFASLIPQIGYQKHLVLKKHSLQTRTIDGIERQVLVLNQEEHGVDEVVVLTQEMLEILDWFEQHTQPIKDHIAPIIQLKDSKAFHHLLYDRMKRKCTLMWDLKKKGKLPDFTPETYQVWANYAEYNTAHVWAQKVFLFSYYAQGMNTRDMAFLKRSDIIDNYDPDLGEYQYFEFRRRKTGALIQVQLSDKLKEIIDWFQEHMPPINDYLLPIIVKPELTGEDLYEHISVRQRQMNVHLKTIAKKCGFPGEIEDLHMYFARHTYATTLRKNGAPIEVISEALGHQDLETTKIYLETFGHKEINKFNKML